MIRPYSFDSETIAMLRRLVAATYSRRDDLYTAAEQLTDEDLSAICRKLADDLADHTAYLKQIIAMHGQDPGIEETISCTLSGEIMRLLRQDRGDQGIVAAIQGEEAELREQYDATIAAVDNPEAQAVLETQKRDVDFAERVLRRAMRPEGK